ncbi:unnamed protein product [Trichogramma brassicae]|uniref:CCHC-type domain-containing protein n=1 Tax=Trichogramma brassicae TaxID=86971 RepID=A0A6H5HTG0_9HYME|nr:unnamed protein product [Trichogramma brassicae]
MEAETNCKLVHQAHHVCLKQALRQPRRKWRLLVDRLRWDLFFGHTLVQALLRSPSCFSEQYKTSSGLQQSSYALDTCIRRSIHYSVHLWDRSIPTRHFVVNLVISKCMVSMLKLFLHKRVASQFTAVKQTKNKKCLVHLVAAKIECACWRFSRRTKPLSVPSDDPADPARPVHVRGRQTGPEESSVLRDPGDEVVHPCGLGPRVRVSVNIELIYYSTFRAGPRTTTQLACPPSVIPDPGRRRASARLARRSSTKPARTWRNRHGRCARGSHRHKWRPERGAVGMLERDDQVYQRTLRAAQRDEITRSVAEWVNALTDEQVSAELQQRSLIVSPEKEINRDRLLRALCYSVDKHCRMQWDTTRDGVLPVFMPATSITPSKGAIKRPSTTDKQTNKSRKSPKDRSRSEETRTRIFTSRAATPRPKGHESALTGGLPAPLIPSINMWPAPEELTRGAPADSAAAANDILPSIELTPPETRRRESESRGNAFSRSPKRSDSEMSDGAPTVVQVPPSQPSTTDNLLRALIHEIRTLSLNQADQLLAINMRLDQELVHRTSSNASRRSSHCSRQNSGKSESDASRTPSSSKKRASDRRQRDPTTPHDGASPAVEASRSETQVPKEQRHAGGDARRDVDTTPKRTENRKNSKKSESVAETSSSPGESDTRRSKKSSLSSSSSTSDGGKSRASRKSKKTRKLKKRDTSSSSSSDDEEVRASRKKTKKKTHKKKKDRSSSSSTASSSSSTSCASASSESSPSESSSSDDSSSDSDASRHRRKGKHHSKKKTASKKAKHGTAKRDEPRRSDEHIMKRLQNWKISFAGGDRAKAEMFITRLAKCSAGTSVDDQRLIDAVQATLSGEADLWYRAARPSFKSWERFEGSFRKMFIGKLGEFKLLQELRNRKQGEEESIVTFIVYFNFYLSHLTEKPSRREQVKIAWNNIRPAYRSALCNRMPRSLKAIQKAGERYEEALAISGNSKRSESETILPLPPKPPRQTHKVAAVSEVDEENSAAKETRRAKPKKKRTPKKKRDKTEESVAAVQNAPKQTTGPGQQQQATTNAASGAARGNNSRFVGACFTCQETGHRASECPQRRCFRCQETGHLSPQCPRAPSTSCQVCGTPNAEFRNCERCAPYRQAWGKRQRGGGRTVRCPAPQRSPN